VASLGGSLGGDTLHGTSITEEAVCVVVEQLVAGLIEAGSEVGLGHGDTDSIGEALAERTGGNLDTGGLALYNFFLVGESRTFSHRGSHTASG
jgi:hypothetical protein